MLMTARKVGLTLLIAALGGAVFAYFGIPAAFLSGAILATALAAIGGAEMRVPLSMRNVSYLGMGVIIGSTVDSGTLALLIRWPVSIAALAVAMAAVLFVVPMYFRKVHGIDRMTAQLSAVPGAMSQVISLADDLDVDARRVVILHSLRLVMLMILVPLVVGAGMVLPPASVAPTPAMDAADLILLSVVATLGIPVAQKARIPSPVFTGPMLVAAVLSGTGIVAGQVPDMIVTVAFVVMGAVVGSFFTGASRGYLISCLGIGAGGIVIAIAITGLIAWPTALWLELPFLQIWLALAPGGFDTMAALALSLGVDPAFVAGHQLVRLMMIYAAIPFLFRKAARA